MNGYAANPHPSQTGSLVDSFPNMSMAEFIAQQVRDAVPILRAMANAQRYPMAWYLDQLGDA